MKKTSPTHIQKRVDQPLVVNKLERVSKEIFRNYFSLITQLIGDSPGVYALYDDNELYYVGKSTDLRNRVKHHLRDRHGASWTHFSLYLARKEEHIHEIESLLIRIASPKGNRVTPKGKSSGPLLKRLKSLVQQKQREEIALLFATQPQVSSVVVNLTNRHTLAGIVKQPTSLHRSYKGTEYKATLHPNGFITMRGKQFTSASAAAKAIVHRSVNGLTFWYIEDLNGDWIKLSEHMKR